MNINYVDGFITNKTVQFEGELGEGKAFTLYANWNDWDDWSVDDITWHDPDAEGTEEEIEFIKEKFLEDMN